MTRALLLLPFAMLLIILPFPGTVAARLLLLVICFGVALRYWWRMPDMRAQIPCKLALAVWVAVAVASLAYAFDPAYTLGELKNELGYTMMAFFAFFTIAGERQNARWLLLASLAGFVLIGSVAVTTWLAHGREWQERAVHGGIGVFGTYLVTMFPVVAWFALDARSSRSRWIALGLGGFLLFLAAIVAQRAVWPVLAIQAMLLLLVTARHGRRAMDRFALIGSAVAIVVFAGAGLLYSQYARFSSPESPTMSADVRFAFWPKVVANIAEHPLAGAGFGRFVMHRAYPELIPPEAPSLWHAHNVFLNYGLQLGLPGMFALAGVFLALAVHFTRATAVSSGAVAGVAGLMLVAGVVLRNQFNDFFLRDMSLLFWALTGLLARLALSPSSASAGQDGREIRHEATA